MTGKLQSMLFEIVHGDDRRYGRTALPRVLRAEDGLMTWATLIAVVLFCALIAMVFNVGRIANDKLETQNAADSAAYSASLVQARTMNAITASNHMMGELTAIYTMHHAIGGKVLDDGRTKGNAVVIALNAALVVANVAADIGWGLSLPTSIANFPEFFSPVDDIPRGEATVYDSKCILKWKMIEQYISHTEGSAKIVKGEALCLTILGFPKGIKLIAEGLKQQAQANREMRAIKKEYQFITQLESFAIGTRDIKKTIPSILDGLWYYECLIAGELVPRVGVQWKCKEAAESNAQKNMCLGEVVGRPSAKNLLAAQAGLPTATLPLVQDPTSNKERTQLMRATYPWVQEWRSPILMVFMGIVPRSRAVVYYEYHTDQYSREICDRFRRINGYKLFVIEEMNATNRAKDKGTESWRLRKNSSHADEMFCVLGLARKADSPSTSHLAFLPNTNPTPIAAMAQAMIYNGNRPTRWKQEIGDYVFHFLDRQPQPVEGWDTLNWTEGATEWKNGKPYFDFLPNDLHWIFGRLDSLDFPFVFPPDVKVPSIPGLPTIAGPPTPKIQLNWQSKLVPIATSNLIKLVPYPKGRLVMVQDAKLRERMTKQVIPAVVSQALGTEVIHH